MQLRADTTPQPRLRPVACLAAGAWLLVSGACHQEPPVATTASRPVEAAVQTVKDDAVSVTMRVDPTEVMVPRPIRLTLAVDVDRDVEVVWPEIETAMGAFGVSEMKESPPIDDGPTRRLERTWTLETFLGGNFAIPPLTVKYIDRRERIGGSTEPVEGEVSTPSVDVKVLGGLADVKPTLSLPIPGWQKVLLWVLGTVAALVAVALAARWWRRRRREAPEDPALGRRLAPHQWALAELDRVLAEDLVRKGQVREFYYRINGLLRCYVELRFNLRAGEQTSEEFIRSLRHAAFFAEEHKELLSRFVAACDPVKYARQQPEPAEVDWVQATARGFIMNTAPLGPGATPPPTP